MPADYMLSFWQRT